MDEESLDVIIHPDGRVELHVKGVKGQACSHLTASLEEALGGEVDREWTPEYYETVRPDRKRNQKAGG